MNPSLPLEVLLRMYDTIRWHTKRPLREQGILEHSAAVAILAMILDPDMPDAELAALLRVALLHDAHETVFGDIPRPALATYRARSGMDLDQENQVKFWYDRQADPGAQVSARGRAVLRLADVLEAAVFSSQWNPRVAARVRKDAEEILTATGTIPGLQAVHARGRKILDDLEATWAAI